MKTILAMLTFVLFAFFSFSPSRLEACPGHNGADAPKQTKAACTCADCKGGKVTCQTCPKCKAKASCQCAECKSGKATCQTCPKCKGKGKAACKCADCKSGKYTCKTCPKCKVKKSSPDANPLL